MEIERMNQQPNERDTNTSNAEAFSAALTVAQGLLTASERNQKTTQSLLETLGALSAQWEKQIDTQRKTVDQQTQMIGKAAQSVSAYSSNGAKDGVKQALSEIRQQALDGFTQAVKPNLSEFNRAVEDIREARKGFERAARYLTWKSVGLYTLVAVLPLLALLGWDRHLVQKIEQERATVQSLTDGGGKVKLSHCGDDHRLCVEIDPKAGNFGVAGKEEYRVIKGY